MSVRLGVTLPQFTSDAARLADAARRAEDLGLDSVWVFDHLWPLSGDKTRPILECWAALAHVAARTDRIGVGTLVTRSTLRHPALVAKMAATVACIAPGRITVGIGSGDALNRDENDAFGIRYVSGAARYAQFESTVRVLRAFFDGTVVDHRDDHARIAGLPVSPRPPQPPALWVGGRAPRMLEVAGRLGDGWNGWGLGPREFARAAARVRDAAGERRVEMTWAGEASDDDATVGRLASLVEAGAEHLVLAFRRAGEPGTYDFVADVVRERLGLAPGQKVGRYDAGD